MLQVERVRVRMLQNVDTHCAGDLVNLPRAIAEPLTAAGVAEEVRRPKENKLLSSAPENKIVTPVVPARAPVTPEPPRKTRARK